MRNVKHISRNYCAQKHKKRQHYYYAATDDVDNGFLYNARLLLPPPFFQREMARRRPNRKIEEMETSLTLFWLCKYASHIALLCGGVK